MVDHIRRQANQIAQIPATQSINRINHITRHPAVSINYPASRNGFQPKNSDASGAPVKSDGDGLTLDNDRNLAKTVGVLQHGLEIPGIFDNIKVVELNPLLGKCFTSCPGVRSSILAKN